MIVVDANILAFYLIAGKRTAATNALHEQDAEWLVPAFWSIEFQSILWKYVRHGAMPREQALDLLSKAIVIFSPNEAHPDPEHVLRDALAWGISVYDAQYLSLAKEFGALCVTEDMALPKACPDIAISLDDFLASPPPHHLLREPQSPYPRRRKPSRS